MTNFTEDHYSSSGCDTCNYGSSYIQNFNVETTKGRMVFNFDQEYEYAITHEFLFRTILPNVEKIKSMTLDEFYDWLVAAFKGEIGDQGPQWSSFDFSHRKEWE